MSIEKTSEKLNRRTVDRSVIETIVSAMAVGFFSSVFGAYIMQARHDVKIDHIDDSIKQLSFKIEKVNQLETRIAILEHEMINRIQ